MNNRYDMLDRMDPNKFMDFIIQLFDKMGMTDEYIPIDCNYCPLKSECKKYDGDLTCLQFLEKELS